MRRSKLVLLSTLSALAILTATTASQATTDMGLLRPQGKWTIGTVNPPEGATYCAMVNQYDKDVVLAFSRDADGQGSIAIDFHDGLFRAGMAYEAKLKIDDTKTRKVSGRASSEGAIVVQVGDDENFYSALREDGNMEVTLAAVDATFALRKFSTSYAELQDCAAELMQSPPKTALAEPTPAPAPALVSKQEGPKTAAVPVQGVEKTPLPMSQEQIAAAQARAKVLAEEAKNKELLKEQERQLAENKAKEAELKRQQDSRLAELKQKLTGDNKGPGDPVALVKKEQEEFAQRAAQLQKERDTLQFQVDASRKSAQESASLKDELAAKLAKTEADAKASGASKQQQFLISQLEEQRKRLAILEQKNSDQVKAQQILQDALANKNREISQIQATQKLQDAKSAEEAGKKEQELSLHADQLQKERDALQAQVEAARKIVQESEIASAVNKSIKDDLASKGAQLADVIKQQIQKSADLARELMKTKTEYQAEQTARQEAEKKLEAVVAESAPLKKVGEELAISKEKLAKLEADMKVAAQQKQELSERLDVQSMQAKVLQAALTAKEQELMLSKKVSGDDKRLARVQAELASLVEGRNAPAVEMLQSQLKEKSDQYDALKKQFDEQTKLQPTVNKVVEELTAKKSDLARLEKQLADVEAQRKAATESAAQAQAQLADTGKKLGLIAADKEKTEAALAAAAAKQTDLETKLALAGQQRQELADSLDAQDKQSKTEQLALIGKVQELLSVKVTSEEDKKKLADLQQQLEVMKTEQSVARAKLQGQLDEKVAQYAALEKQFDERLKGMTAAKAQDVAHLEKLVAEAEERRIAAAELATKAQTDLALKQAALDEKSAQFDAIKKQLDEQNKNLPVAFRTAAELSAKKDEISRLEKRLAEMETQYKAASEDAAQAHVQVAEMTKRQVQSPVLESQVTILTQQKQDLAMQLDTQEKQLRALQDTLNSKDKVLADADADRKKLLAVQKELDALKPEYASVVKDLMAQLKDKTALLDGAQKQIEEQSKSASGVDKISAELSVKKAAVARLEGQLAEANTQRQSVADEAAKTMAELNKSRQQIAQLQETLKQQQAALEKKGADQVAELDRQKAELDKKEADLERQSVAQRQQAEWLESEKARVAQSGPSVPVQQVVSAQKTELDAARQRIQQLEKQTQDSQSRVAELEANLQRSKAAASAENMAALAAVKLKQEELERRSAEIDARESTLSKQSASAEKRGQAVASLPDVELKSAAASVADIEPASGGDDAASAKVDAVPLAAEADHNRAESFLNKVMAYHRVPGSAEDSENAGGSALKQAALSVPAKVAAAISEPVTLEALLNNSGVAVNNFVPLEQTDSNVVSQWTSGNINGMYEQVASTNDFNGQVASYLDRYRQDCGNNLKISLTPAETSKIGTIASADIECTMPSNVYSSSLMFLQDKNGFSIILHTAYPSERGKVQNIRNTIVQALKGSQGFSAPQVIKQNVGSGKSMKFNIPASTAAEPSTTRDDFGTVVVQ